MKILSPKVAYSLLAVAACVLFFNIVCLIMHGSIDAHRIVISVLVIVILLMDLKNK